MRILVVEDESIVGYIVGKILTEAGHDILGPARSVRAAIACMAGPRPDLALIDIFLSDGASGADLARRMRRTYAVPAIFMSATPDECREVASFSGVLGCLSKPFTEHELLLAVDIAQAIIDGQPAAHPPPACLELYDS